jgi:quaternary ammonium compound-resistance protein SugE
MKLNYWFYLTIAAIFEVCWTYSLKYMDLKKINTLSFKLLFTPYQSSIIGPIAGYILFGLGNIFFFSLAMKVIPPSIAFAVWMAITLIGLKCTDTFFFKESFSILDTFYILLIIIGIIGLNRKI